MLNSLNDFVDGFTREHRMSYLEGSLDLSSLVAILLLAYIMVFSSAWLHACFVYWQERFLLWHGYIEFPFYVFPSCNDIANCKDLMWHGVPVSHVGGFFSTTQEGRFEMSCLRTSLASQG